MEPGEYNILYNFRNDEREVNIERLSLTKDEWEEKKEHLVIPYEYAKGDDLYHIGLYDVEGEKYLFFDVCHIISDGMTMNILIEDLSNIYLGNKVKKSDYSFYEYILDEYARDAAGLREKDVETFKKLLENFEIKRSILARKDSYDLTTAHNASLLGIFEKLDKENLARFCKNHGISENVIFISAFAYAVELYASTGDVAITSIHNGRTDGRWTHLAGSFFATYVFRYKKTENDTVDKMLKRNANEILHTMETHMSSQHADEMFIQYQGSLLNMPEIGGEPAERVKIQLDSLPFHLMIYSKSSEYTYELRYWKNRFDGEMLEIFMRVMEDVLCAMLEESEVNRINSHISEKYYPKNFEISSLDFNEAVGREIIHDASENDMIKPYVIDNNGHKKPYGAWGKLFILNHMINKDGETIESIYPPGILYDTGINARISPNNQIETLERAGRTVMRETLQGRFYIDLYMIEQTLIAYPGIKSAKASMQYGKDNLFYVKTVIETSQEIDENELKILVCKKLGKHMMPEINEIKKIN